MSLQRISAQDAAEIIANPAAIDEIRFRRRDPNEPTGDLDRAWGGLDYLLGCSRTPVILLFTGTIIDPASFSVWSVDDVKSAAGHLAATSFETLAAHYDPAAMNAEGIYPKDWEAPESSLPYLQLHYANLQKFLQHAASTQSAALWSHG
ncbi:Domain of uncharacterised function (DUF1877) [Mycobacteroides abscessus subsp. abscessus]|uniref:DUF1877 family protein n=1 Tax=Mycobacteroides abscessus TaxID=36809 RepID=UPI000927D63E|nr:DUF1877 family protein [Mycobacteroides abscessus]SIH38930.1 Domain of uncharacterised function (DUF1877) [Mycobacteroides abscessus subsp. abscessus]